MNYEIIATGSSGNATVIEGKILIDCGVQYRELLYYTLDLELVLLTHEHGDHFNESAVRRLARNRPALRWACCEWMVDRLLQAGVSKYAIDVMEPGKGYLYGGLATVRPEKLTHNVPNCGWHIRIGNERLFYATDTGTLEGVEAKGYDLYMVEANHSRAELESRIADKEARGEYAYEIRAAENHLSFEQAIDWFAENGGPKSLWIPMHGHIDRGGKQNGRPQDAGPDDNGE